MGYSKSHLVCNWLCIVKTKLIRTWAMVYSKSQIVTNPQLEQSGRGSLSSQSLLLTTCSLQKFPLGYQVKSNMSYYILPVEEKKILYG